MLHKRCQIHALTRKPPPVPAPLSEFPSVQLEAETAPLAPASGRRPAAALWKLNIPDHLREVSPAGKSLTTRGGDVSRKSAKERLPGRRTIRNYSPAQSLDGICKLKYYSSKHRLRARSHPCHRCRWPEAFGTTSSRPCRSASAGFPGSHAPSAAPSPDSAVPRGRKAS